MVILANFLTLLRIVAIPFIIWGFFLEDKEYGAQLIFVLFILASITDYFDGVVARKFNGASKFGRMLDPIADKMLVTSVLIMLVFDEIPNAAHDGLRHPRADLIAVLIIISREILVSGLREFLAMEVVLMPVTKLAKWKTTFQFLALVSLLAVPLSDTFIVHNVELSFQTVGQILLWIAALLTFITGWQYFRHTMREAFKENKVLEIKLLSDQEKKT